MELLRSDLQGYKPASNLQLNDVIKERISKGASIYHLAFGQSPFPVISSATEALKRYADVHDYLPANGLENLRQEIAAFHFRYDGITIDPDNIVISAGSKQLIYLLLTVFRGDILIASPTWTTYRPQTKLSGRRSFIVETKMADGWRLTPDILEKRLSEIPNDSPKLLIFCHPDNPTGTSYSDSELESLSEVFRRHKMVVLSDEIYGRLRFDGNHKSLIQLYPEGTVLSTGLSKWASAGGWRLGYHAFPSELRALRDAVKSAGSHTYSCAPAPMQHAAIEMFRDRDGCDDYIRHTSRILETVANHCYRELTSVGVTAVLPTAGYYIFPNFEILREPLRQRGITLCEDMCTAMLNEASVAVMAGGPPYLRPVEELTVRLCYVDFDGGPALAKSRSVGLSKPLPDDFVKVHCSKIYEGIRSLTDWVRSQLK